MADRERVGIELGNAAVDLLSVQSLLGDGVSAASVDALKQAASLFGGEFLDGLDLPLCYRYQEWCMAEREAVSRLRLAVLASARRAASRPSRGRAAICARPCGGGPACAKRPRGGCPAAVREGRNKEALGHYEHARRVLETELGVRPSDELEEARQTLRSAAQPRVAAKRPARASDIPAVPRPPPARSAFVGREAERALIDQIVASGEQTGSDVRAGDGRAGYRQKPSLAHVAPNA